MKSLVTLNAELDALKAKANAILDMGEAENRKLNDEEKASFDTTLAEIKAKEQEIKETETEQNKLTIKQTPNKMEKQNFSLLKAIRSLVNNEPMADAEAAVINAGKEQMRNAGINSTGSIVIPTGECRAAVSVTTSSGATVPVDVAPILDELRAESVLEKAGATYFTGLVGDLKVPMMTAASVAWAAETAAASDAAAAVAAVTLQPKRLTAYMDISKQLLIQDAGSNAEAALQANLIRAINEKFESTVLGTAAGSTTQPAGMFYGKTATSTTTWAGVADLEATVERAKGRVTAVVCSPEAKAAFRAMTYNKTTQLVYQDGFLEDIPCYSTASVGSKTYIAGDWRYLAVGQWGGIDLTVDPFTQAGNGMIRLVINVYMDAAIPTAAASVFAYGTVASGN